MAPKYDEWVAVTAASPCSICKHPDWCQISKDGTVAMCMRTADGAFKSKPTRSGAEAHYHRLAESPECPQSRPVTATSTQEIADADTRNRVYSAFLAELALSENPKYIRSRLAWK